MKELRLQFGVEELELQLPDGADIFSADHVEPLVDPAGRTRRSLREPIGTAGLAELAAGRGTAAVVVSDNTRPVPYKGAGGILAPIIETLQGAGVGSIKIIVGTGTHRSMGDDELRDMLGESAYRQGVEVINHDCTDRSVLRDIGSTSRTKHVTINRHYLDADLKIVTGLVEPHFMAGVSGGRKGVCPGICGQEVTYGFHSASILNDPGAGSMVIESNPCHEESLEIARMAGVDFIVNVTVDSAKKVTGVFSGELEQAHMAAYEYLRRYAIIELDQSYDLVVTQSGEVGMNHYQCAKSAYEACQAVRPGGEIIMSADLADADPIGGENYKKMLRLSVELGASGFCQKILAGDWRFVPEQWQVQMWSRVFMRLDSAKNLYICSPQLEGVEAGLIPETNVSGQAPRQVGESNLAYAGRMMQETIDAQVRGREGLRVLALPDGPYAVTLLKGGGC